MNAEDLWRVRQRATVASLKIRANAIPNPLLAEGINRKIAEARALIPKVSYIPVREPRPGRGMLRIEALLDEVNAALDVWESR